MSTFHPTFAEPAPPAAASAPHPDRTEVTVILVVGAA
jgi:hypothetical protein